MLQLGVRLHSHLRFKQLFFFFFLGGLEAIYVNKANVLCALPSQLHAHLASASCVTCFPLPYIVLCATKERDSHHFSHAVSEDTKLAPLGPLPPLLPLLFVSSLSHSLSSDSILFLILILLLLLSFSFPLFHLSHQSK